jgi:hypothetical protein
MGNRPVGLIRKVEEVFGLKGVELVMYSALRSGGYDLHPEERNKGRNVHLILKCILNVIKS